MPQPTVIDILRRSTSWLSERGIEQPRLDAELLIAHALGVKRLDLYVQYDRPLQEDELSRARALIQARGGRKPVAYLIGEREFYSLPFQVDARVLVPRPETEHLVDLALEALKPLEAPVLADVGTGSGCIAIAVLANHPGARAHALDVSADALEVARANAEQNGVADRIAFHEGDLLEPLRGSEDWGTLDAVLSNPPYVLRDDPNVDPDVREHEPEAALYVPGDDALSFVRRIAETAREALRPGGFVAFEVGYESGADAVRLLTELGYEDSRVLPDLAGIDRIATARTSSRTAAP
ncbi:MAG: peptide chain release factor N(5)-glutamine methyltransferase [Planctomycetota bacterium]|nr:peptide chain release factor N(5)-glutamine methyltransferase [Planctomycetota bacterium]